MKNLFSKKDIVAIVPAAGIGKRMKIKYPKQYVIIGQYTIIEHCILNLLANPHIKQIIVVLNYNDQYFYKLPLSHNNQIICVIGGKTRAQSVLSGLKAAYGTTNWVLVHDASRPCLHINDLTNLIQIREKSNIGGILATPVVDTLKLSQHNKNIINKTVKRKNLWRALTPQLFSYSLLKFCLTKTLKEGINVNDESSALEYCGYYPMLIQGRNDNIKVTYPEDILLAEFYINKNFSQDIK
ncbi:2-C-methyl-D-erythritol 4-phosphate cytidylyltransferase [Candidatus Pantoea edessiphila]|uniref:2-C-methyl-D-erythritol 4-phosphate cytidylyltransferase n=1 Tax=Candidatus Pantoea edessiphila TaxID=2044610 RepID=A0A2P5SZM8_9GAMM|nr:2-C-methyl-D-erythritol 4-phosphate cytidylyltransferase [Candidatus Pantoea edessiphila]PPI87798.1 2-C-methyl-D-erythritol 4-phosphate cytidylyltransferase [Candidatus Pantoea edessiphila]